MSTWIWDPKTESSLREIPLQPDTIDAMDLLRLRSGALREVDFKENHQASKAASGAPDISEKVVEDAC